MTEANCTAARPCAPHASRGGFTMIEMLLVIVIAGLMMGIAIPTFLKFSDKNAINSAAVAVSTMNSRARLSAVQRGRTTRLMIQPSSNQMWIVSMNVAGTGYDTLGSVENLNTRFGITFTTSSTSISYTPRGIGTATTSTTIILSKGTKADTLTVTPAGRMLGG